MVQWGPHAERRRTSASNWRQPLKWNAEAERLGLRYRVFCSSLADVFDNAVDPQWRQDLFTLIQRTPNLDWLLLTKRIGNVPGMVSIIPGHLPPNVWLGATVVNQAEADRDIPKLLAVPAAKRFLSMEPLLGPVNLGAWIEPWNNCGYCGESFDFEQDRADLCPGCGQTGCMCTGFGSKLRSEFDNADGRLEVPDGPGIDWVIVGGESGPGARPMHPAWVRSLRDQCQAAGVPFFFKQWGEWAPAADDDLPTSYGSDACKNFRCMCSNGFVGEMDIGTALLHKPKSWPKCFPDGDQESSCAVATVHRVGKKAAGRLLDGREWNEVPA